MILNALLAAYPDDFVWNSNWTQSLVDDVLSSKTILHTSRSLPEVFKELEGCQKYCGRNQECMGCFRKFDETYTWTVIEGNEIGKVNFEDRIFSLKPGSCNAIFLIVNISYNSYDRIDIVI